ncbi:hypothetical protein EDD85DRAFT_257783 [Armillaria nabsnona]|nr:hypothetical protein EDD85DRAFT_257783 [Armillaria nabsnona]
MNGSLMDIDGLVGLLETDNNDTGQKSKSSPRNSPCDANIPELMKVLSQAHRSIAQTLISFMERVISLTFVRRTPLARTLERARTIVYNLLKNVYNLLEEAILLLRSAADAVQLRLGSVSFKALDATLIGRLKTFRSRCRMLRNTLPDVESAFDSGRADLEVELKILGFHHVSRMLYLLPGALGTHAAVIDDLPVVFSDMKRWSREIVTGVDAFEQRVMRFRDCFADASWVERMVGNPILVKGMVDVMLSISDEWSRLCGKLYDVSVAPVGVRREVL